MMKILDIYEKVALDRALEQRRFFNYFNDTVAELEGQYFPLVIEAGAEFEPVKDINAVVPVRELYAPAIADNIRYLADETAVNAAALKQEYLRKADGAWRKYWHDNAHGRKVRQKNGV